MWPKPPFIWRAAMSVAGVRGQAGIEHLGDVTMAGEALGEVKRAGEAVRTRRSSVRMPRISR